MIDDFWQIALKRNTIMSRRWVSLKACFCHTSFVQDFRYSKELPFIQLWMLLNDCSIYVYVPNFLAFLPMRACWIDVQNKDKNYVFNT